MKTYYICVKLVANRNSTFKLVVLRNTDLKDETTKDLFDTGIYNGFINTEEGLPHGASTDADKWTVQKKSGGTLNLKALMGKSTTPLLETLNSIELLKPNEISGSSRKKTDSISEWEEGNCVIGFAVFYKKAAAAPEKPKAEQVASVAPVSRKVPVSARLGYNVNPFDTDYSEKLEVVVNEISEWLKKVKNVTRLDDLNLCIQYGGNKKDYTWGEFERLAKDVTVDELISAMTALGAEVATNTELFIDIKRR